MQNLDIKYKKNFQIVFEILYVLNFYNKQYLLICFFMILEF